VANGDTDAPSGDGVGQPDAGPTQDAGTDAGFNCDACTNVECWEACGHPALLRPEAPDCGPTATFTDEFEALWNLDPATLYDLFNTQGACDTMSDAADFYVVFTAPRDGTFQVTVQALNPEQAGNFDLLVGKVDMSKDDYCQTVQALPCPKVTAVARSGSVPMKTGESLLLLVQVAGPVDLAFTGEYEPPQQPTGGSCTEDAECQGVSVCDGGVCACGDQAVSGIGPLPDGSLGMICGCPDGFTPNWNDTACEEEEDPCDPNPCDPGLECSVVQGEAVCAQAVAQLGEKCGVDTPCESGLSCQFIPCPYAAGGSMCVTPCTSSSTCSEGNIACPKTSDSTLVPTCLDHVDGNYCTWYN